MEYEIVIWLEIHAKLNAVNKLFCQCINSQDFDHAEPNMHICPFCTAQPWALPVLSKEPVEKAILLWKALQCTIQEYSLFERKSYFYPDLPTWYQITQVAQPVCIDWSLAFFVDNDFSETKSVRIRDIHLENDTGKSIRDGKKVLLDFNRAGTPLVEIVTQPDFRSSQEVVAFLKELQRIIKLNNIGDAQLENGQMRADVNISIRPRGTKEFGTRVEMKNMNSYSAIERAIAHEVARQQDILAAWWTVDQETRRRNDAQKDSFCMRSKEEAMDYRYMPEPDLPPLHLPASYVDQVVEHHWWVSTSFERIVRYKNDYQFNKEYINGLIADSDLMLFFEQTVAAWKSYNEAAKWLVSSVARWLNAQQVWFSYCKLTVEDYCAFLDCIETGKISWPQAKLVIDEIIQTWRWPDAVIESLWFVAVTETDIKQRLDQLFQEKPDLLSDIQAWNMKPMWFIIGHVMKQSNGSANPAMIQEVIQRYKK